MQGVLRIISGSEFGRVVQLDGTRALLVGRSEEADVAIPTDLLMSSRHCRITPGPDGFQIEDLNSTNGTYVNGGQISHRLLRDGDTIRCGDTEFQAAIDILSPATSSPAAAPIVPVPIPSSSTEAARTPAAEHDHDHAPPHAHPSPTQQFASLPFSVEDLGPEQGYLNPLAISLTERFELVDDLETLPLEAESVDEYLDRLIATEQQVSALKFLAFALPRRTAVWWGRACVEFAAEGPWPPAVQQLLETAAAWVKQPNEDRRVKIKALVEPMKPEFPAAWVGWGICWSHGSMAGAEHPPVPPPPGLTGKAIGSAALLAAFQGNPQDAEMKQRKFIGMAREFAATPKPWAL